MSFLPALPAILGAVGTGISFIGGMQQASAAQAVANQNALIQEQNARSQADILRTQAELTRVQTQQNFQNRQLEAVQQSRNADAVQEQARVQQAIDALNLRRKREEGGRLMASQRARFAAAGIVESTGSPLSIIAETAGLIEKDAQETKYAQELAQTGLLNKAHLERLGGQFALAGATLDKSAGLAEASLQNASATATLLTGRRQAQITRLAGKAEATGMRYGAFGGLLSGAAKTASLIPKKSLIP